MFSSLTEKCEASYIDSWGLARSSEEFRRTKEVLRRTCLEDIIELGDCARGISGWRVGLEILGSAVGLAVAISKVKEYCVMKLDIDQRILPRWKQCLTRRHKMMAKTFLELLQTKDDDREENEVESGRI